MTTLNKSLLVSLFELAQDDTPASVQVLSELTGLGRPQIATSLNELALLGFLRPETLRLTFVGLMKATGLRRSVSHSQAA